MSSSPKLRVGIVGGGIGGLTLALAITRLDVDTFVQVDIYEAAEKLTQVGAGITLWPRGREMIKDLGLEDDLVAHMSPGQELPSKMLPKCPFILKKGDQQEDVRLPDLIFRGGSISFHRADIQGVLLLKHISLATQIHLNRRLVSYRESSGPSQGIELYFKNGEVAVCDLLVGADGVHLVVCTGFLAQVHNLTEEEAGKRERPVWSGSIIYRSVIESELIRKQAPNHPCLTNPRWFYLGKSKHVVSYPISCGKFINVAAFYSELDKEGTFVDGPAVTESTTDAVSFLYEKWSEEVQCITKNLYKPSKWAVETVRPLDKYTEGRVFLLGDSAHAMTPHLRNGTGQAIEDAYILAQVLNKALRQAIVATGKAVIDIPKIAEVYSTIRQPFGNFAADASRSQGLWYDLQVPGFEDVKEGDAVSAEKLSSVWEAIERDWRWCWGMSVSFDVERALEMI